MLVVEDKLPLEDADARRRGCVGRSQVRRSASRGWKPERSAGEEHGRARAWRGDARARAATAGRGRRTATDAEMFWDVQEA
jgi:hypothetical protein